MNNPQTAGVSETRYALTVLIVLLLGIGYVILGRLGGGGDLPSIELRRYHPIEEGMPDAVAIERSQVPPAESVEPPVIQALQPNDSTDQPSVRLGRRGPAESPQANGNPSESANAGELR